MLFDTVIQNARAMDPETGLDAQRNIGILDGRIAAVTTEKLTGKEQYDAMGLIASPGFIDIHTHEDTLQTEGHDGKVPAPTQTALSAMKTGCTTIVTGNCGMSAENMALYSQALAEANLPIRVAYQVGNMALRSLQGLDEYTNANTEQIAAMGKALQTGLSTGALGASFGLQYAPGTSREEFTALCKELKRAGKYAAVHMRYDFPAKAIQAVKEVVEVAQETGVSMQISHLAANVYGAGMIEEAARLIENSGADITCDMYPYNVWATGLQSAVFDDGFNSFNFGVEDLEILTGPYAGEYCTAALFQKLRTTQEDTQVACHNAMPLEDVVHAYSLPFVFMGSDGQLIKDAAGHIKGHPRGATSPVKFLSEFVRDKHCCTLMEGIAKLTLLPAKRCGFEKRGRLQQGCDADITLFSLEQLRVEAGFGVDVCAKPPAGIKLVLGQGKRVWEEPKST